jgi:hypothetical protein
MPDHRHRARRSRRACACTLSALIAADVASAGAFLPGTVPWPDNTVPYALTNAPPETRRAFLAAADHIAAHSAVRFVERSWQADYLYVNGYSNGFVPSCHADIGQVGGPQELALGPGCNGNDALHELLHVLGLQHEHQRPDRDRHIAVPQRATGVVIGQEAVDARLVALGDFDHDSAMLYPYYPPHDARIRPRPGLRDTLSRGDIAALATLYPGAAPAARPAGDNGLSARVERRELALAPGQASRLRVDIDGTAQVVRHAVWSTSRRLRVRSTRLSPTAFMLDLHALPGAERRSRAFLTVHAANGKVGTVALTVAVLAPATLAREPRQLVLPSDAWRTPLCLDAVARSPLPVRTDATTLMRHAAVPELGVIATPCDGDRALQFWHHRPDGQLENGSGHCLGREGGRHAAQALRLVLRRCTAPGTATRWQRRDGQWQLEADPGLALTLGAESTPLLAPLAMPVRDDQTWQWR